MRKRDRMSMIRSRCAGCSTCGSTPSPQNPPAAAREVLEGFATRFDRLLVHFDVDTVDFTDAPLSENTGRNEGLSLDDALSALAVLVSSERLSALTITELNPLHGADDGSTLDRFVAGLVDALAPAT